MNVFSILKKIPTLVYPLFINATLKRTIFWKTVSTYVSPLLKLNDRPLDSNLNSLRQEKVDVGGVVFEAWGHWCTSTTSDVLETRVANRLIEI